MKLFGDEYENAQSTVVRDPRGTCAAPLGRPESCWTWTAQHLGNGTYAIARPIFRGVHLVWTFTLTDAHGATLTGNVVEGFIPDPSRSDAITHANRYPQTYTFLGGTERFSGVTGVLTVTTSTTAVSIDPVTGVTHAQSTGQAVGTLTFPSKL